MTNANSAIASQRQRFFEYFRARLETLNREDVPVPERLVLASACLDALANHWNATADPSLVPRNLNGTDRMRHLLLSHGGHPAFDRVSAPMLRNATGHEVGGFPFAEYRPNVMNEVRDWRHDPTFAELVGTGVDPKLLARWSYAGILYKDFRCAWVHNFVGSKTNITLNDFVGRGEPNYRFIGNLNEFILVFPLPFLVATVRNVIESFERETIGRDILPFEQ